MSRFYVTFGSNRGGGHVVVHAKDINEARSKIFASEYKDKWCWMYTEEEWEKMEATDMIGFNAPCKEEI